MAKSPLDMVNDDLQTIIPREPAIATVGIRKRVRQKISHSLSFNGKFRAECLNAHWFMSLDDARQKMEEWRKDYNEVRPHSAIGNKPSAAPQSGLSRLPPARPS